MMSISTVIAGELLLQEWLTPRTLTVVSGVLSASPGVVWLLLFASGRLRMPPTRAQAEDEAQRAALVSAN